MKVMVISHERSGTHFLIDTLAINFGYDNKQIDLDVTNTAYPLEMGDALHKGPLGELYHDLDINRVFKSHHPRDFFEACWGYLVDQYKVFYVARDGRDVMASFWRHHWKVWHNGPKCFTVGQFIRHFPMGYMDRYHGKLTPRNMVDRWDYHIMSWMGTRYADVCYIKYEDLSSDFERTVEKIAAHVGIKKPETPIKPELGGVSPWRGIVGNWKEHFKEETQDELFFWQFGHKAMEILGYAPSTRT